MWMKGATPRGSVIKIALRSRSIRRRRLRGSSGKCVSRKVYLNDDGVGGGRSGVKLYWGV